MGGMLIGLTGTFGSGKSTVAAILAEWGAEVLDADAFAREAVEPGEPAIEEIRERLGADFILPDGRLDRGKMAAAVFRDAVKRRQLESIIHPRVAERMKRSIAEWRDRKESAPMLVLNVPLLFECGISAWTDRNLVVTVGEGERFYRVRRRDGISERQVIERLASQWPQRDKARRADAVIDNTGSIESTREQAGRIFGQWLKESETKTCNSGS